MLHYHSLFSKKLHQAFLAGLLVVAAQHGASAADWEYPVPEVGQDVKDLSFYAAAADGKRLPAMSDTRPRRVILMIGDGMGFNHVALARHRAVGADKRLHMERMPVGGVMRTHSANQLVTDSAAASTAIATGVKTHNGRIGMAADGTEWKSIMMVAKDEGFRTGLVVTSTLSHATPAGFVAHAKNRGMEPEIAARMFDRRVDVLFGGGRKHWVPAPAGTRGDGRNLIDEARAAGYQVIHRRDDLGKPDALPVLGVFADDGMTTLAPEPMLHEMTATAIKLLSGKPARGGASAYGFFMMVEGSQIDWASHGNDEDSTIRQTLLFDMAVRQALDFALRDKQTLVIVTADHETGGLLLKTGGGKVSAGWTSKDHTAADVPVYAFGPGSGRFGGVLDISDLPKNLADLLGFEEFPVPVKKERDAR